MVHLLPHERFDLYKNTVSRLTSMEKCLSDLTTCKNNENTCQEIVKVSKRVNQDMEVPLPAQVMVENIILSRQEQKNEENPIFPEQMTASSQEDDAIHKNIGSKDPHQNTLNKDQTNEDVLKVSKKKKQIQGVIQKIVKKEKLFKNVFGIKIIQIKQA